MHHTTGEPRCDRSAECYAPIVAQIFTARHLEDAAAHIDSSIKLCISKRKPVYLGKKIRLFKSRFVV
jgi:TPP-dependent 2-oxoacid decarboxylase